MRATSIPPRAVLLLVILTVVWGTNWSLFKYAVAELSVWTFRLISTIGAGLVLLALARLRGQSLAIAPAKLPTIVAATMFHIVIWNLASTTSAVLIPSGQASILGYTMPLWSALLGWLFLRQALTPRLSIAMALGAAAVALLILPGWAAYRNAPLGVGAGLLAGFAWAAGTVILKRQPIGVAPIVLTGWQLLIAAVPIGVLALAFGDRHWFMPSWQTIWVLGYITLLPIALGNFCWFAIVDMLPANIAGLSTIMVPIVAMVTGALVHQEPLGLTQVLAIVCSVAALSLTVFKPRA